MIYTVQDLINELRFVADKNKPIFIYDEDGEILTIKSIDMLSDRVDLNT